MRNALLGTVRFFNAPDLPGGAPAPAVAVEPAAAPAESPAGAAPAASAVSSPPAQDAVAGPAAGEPTKVADAHAEPTMLEGVKIAEPTKAAEGGAKEGEKASEGAGADAPVVADPNKPADGQKAEAVGDAAAAAKTAEGGATDKPADGAADKAGDPPPAPEPIKYEFKFPDGIKVDDAQLAPAIEVLREAGVKPEQAQKLLDQHIGAMQQLQTHTASEQQRVWQETRAGWRQEVMSDAQIGGAGHQTAMQAIAGVRDMLVHPNDMPSFNEFLRVTGAGDHPMFLKLLHNASRYLNEPAGLPAGGAPPPDAGKKPGKQRLSGIYKDNEAARRGA